MIKFSEKGMMLVTILMLTFLLVMLTTSMLLIASQNLNITGTSENKSKALQAAEAGVEYAFYQLNNDIYWGLTPPLYTTPLTSDIKGNLGNDQSFTIVFNPSSPRDSQNNLTGPLPDGTTPSYSAEIISKGTYKGTEKIVRAIFVRDDNIPCCQITEGNIYIKANPILWSVITYNVKGKTPSDPGKIHANSNISLTSFTPGGQGYLDFNKGFPESSSNITLTGWMNTVKTKEEVLPKKVPDINISSIINKYKSSCHSLDPNSYFYFVGYFEHDTGDTYCIPHCAPSSWAPDDPYVYTSSYTLGIAKINENDPVRFINNYGHTMYNSLTHTPPAPASQRNLYDPNYYPPPNLTFLPLDPNDPNFINLENSLGMTISASPPDPNDSSITVTLALNNDIYIPNTIGIYQTGYVLNELDPNMIYVYAPNRMIWGVKMQIDLNGHYIFADKEIYLAIPVVNSSFSRGGIISNDSVDFVLGSADMVKMIVLSGRNVKACYWAPGAGNNPGPYPPSQSINFKGMLYARDSIITKASSAWLFNKAPYLVNGKDINFTGSMVSKDSDPNERNDNYIPISDNYSNNSNGLPGSISNIYAMSIFMGTSSINITYSNDGMVQLVPLRGKDFKVRKQIYEVLK